MAPEQERVGVTPVQCHVLVILSLWHTSELVQPVQPPAV
jgi:hypothetical protein